jgi:hypothetical protein
VRCCLALELDREAPMLAAAGGAVIDTPTITTLSFTGCD